MSNRFGSRNTRAAELTPVQVLEIRELYHNQQYTQRRLGRMYNVATETIGRIVRNDTWKGVGGPGTDREPSADENLHEAALEMAAKLPLSPQAQAEATAAAARIMARLTQNEERTDDLPRQTNDLHSDDQSAGLNVPSHDVSEHQSGEEAEPVAGRIPGTGEGR
jgi:hypothetical protein